MAWYPAAVTIAAASEPVTLAEAKAQLRVTSSDEDTLIGNLIASARGYVESYCGTPLVSRTVAVKCDTFTDFNAVPVAPVISIASISYVDGAGDTQTLSTDVYEFRSDGLIASVVLKYGQIWPAMQSGSRVTVTAVVGYASIPAAVKHAILLLIADWERNAGNTVIGSNTPAEMPHAVTALLTNHRMFGF